MAPPTEDGRGKISLFRGQSACCWGPAPWTFTLGDSLSEPGHRLEKPNPHGQATGRRHLGVRPSAPLGWSSLRLQHWHLPAGPRQPGTEAKPPHCGRLELLTSRPLRECNKSVTVLSHTIKVEVVCFTEIENRIIKRVPSLSDGCPITSNLNDLKPISFPSKTSCFADI